MHAYLALALALVTAALAVPAPRDLYEREIDNTRYNHGPILFDYVLGDDYLSSHKNRAKLVTRLRPDEAVADENVILESNVVKIVKPAKRDVNSEEIHVRQRRGYNLENVRVPARYPYLPVPNYNRFRRWG